MYNLKLKLRVAQNTCYKHTTKEMLSKEIRIGNLLSYNNSLDSIGEVTEIRKSLIIGSDKVRFGYRTDKLHKFNDCKPIRLSDFWLKRFGFKESEFEKNTFELNHANGWIKIDTDCKEIYFYDEESKLLYDYDLPNFVHELQNTVYFFERIDLTTK